MESNTCVGCNKAYSSRSSLNKHLKVVHKNVRAIVDINIHNAKCHHCSCSFMQIKELRNHLMQFHDFPNDVEEFEFQSFDDFNVWLLKISKENNIQFVRQRNYSKKKASETVSYYYCNRSVVAGKSQKRKVEDRKRLQKSQGPSKLDYLCTSQIKVLEKDKKLKVIHFKTHYGHSIEVQHLRLDKNERSAIANRLVSGVSVDRILDHYRNNFAEENGIKRQDLITRKDINNIKLSFGIASDEGRRNSNDAVSIELFVEEQKNSIDNSVLYYKSQGAVDELLRSEDFCLILMNKSQLYMLKFFGKNIICIDSTHGLNQYDFELTTLMVIDEFGEGFPAATMFTNRKDTYIFEIFFMKVKDKVGYAINTKTFMTDITHVFINAWKTVMQESVMHLFCAWHVDKAWQNNLNKIKNLDKRKLVYQTVKCLQNYENDDGFLDLLLNAIDTFNEDTETQEWGIYFQRNYGLNYKLWAACYRKNSGINTNMHLESMHKIIKYCYLEGKNVARLDKGLHAVLKYVRDKVVDRVMKKTKGKNNSHIRKIHDRHRLAVVNDHSVDIDYDNRLFHVKSENGVHFYQVRKCLDASCCALQCKFCNICIHSFSCTCPDFFLKSTICKHVHAVVLKDLVHTLPTENEMQIEQENITEVCETDIHLETLKSKEIKPLCSMKAIDLKLDEIKQKAHLDPDNDGLHECYGYLQKASLILNVGHKVKETTLPTMKFQASNKKILKQSFFSTKKHTTRKQTLIKKPNEEESTCIRDTLLKSPFISKDPAHDHTYI